MKTPNFRSEYGEDRWIFENLPLPEGGFYVDAGARDPLVGSNTAFLRELGWAGIAIDADPLCRSLWTNPPLTVAVLSDKPEGQFIYAGNGAWNRRMEDCHARLTGDSVQYPVQCRTLQSILEQDCCGTIDFLSIDVEGAEFDVMKGLDYDRYKPGIIVAEYSTQQFDGSVVDDARLWGFLTAKGYRVMHQTESNGHIVNIIYQHSKL